MRDARLLLALLVFAASACAPAAPPSPAPSSPVAVAPPPAPDLSIPERLSVFAPESQAGSASRWDLWRGTCWPAWEKCVAFLSRATGRLERLFRLGRDGSGPTFGVVVAASGAVLILSEAPRLVPASGAAPITLPGYAGSASFSPDGARLLTAGHRDFVLVDVNEGREILRRSTDLAPDAGSVEWLGARLLVGRPEAYSVLRSADLVAVLPHASGPPSPDRARMVDVPMVPDASGFAAGRVALRVLDAHTGQVVYTARGHIARNAYDLAVRWTPDGRFLIWRSDTLHVMEWRTKRVASMRVPVPAGAESYAAVEAAASDDGAHACFGHGSWSASYDLRRHVRLRDAPGRAFRCAVERGAAIVVEVPLAAHEALFEPPSYGGPFRPHPAISGDRSRAAVLVVDPRVPDSDPRPLTLLLVDLATKGIAARVALGLIAPGRADPSIRASADGLAIEVETVAPGSSPQRRHVDFRTGALGPAPAPAPSPPWAFQLQRNAAPSRLTEYPAGTLLATIVPFASGSELALFEDGRVEWLGEPVTGPEVVCAVRDEVVAQDRCAPLVDRGAVARALAAGAWR